MVVNELKGLIYIYIYKENKIEIHQKMIMIWHCENMAHFNPFKC
jgi:hypothetical protein